MFSSSWTYVYIYRATRTIRHTHTSSDDFQAWFSQQVGKVRTPSDASLEISRRGVSKAHHCRRVCPPPELREIRPGKNLGGGVLFYRPCDGSRWRWRNKFNQGFKPGRWVGGRNGQFFFRACVFCVSDGVFDNRVETDTRHRCGSVVS